MIRWPFNRPQRIPVYHHTQPRIGIEEGEELAESLRQDFPCSAAREQYLAEWECSLWLREEALSQREAEYEKRETAARSLAWFARFNWICSALAVVVLVATLARWLPGGH